MIFFGFVEKLRFTEIFKKVQLAQNLVLEPYSKASLVVKYFESAVKPEYYPKCPILTFKILGPERKDLGCWFAWEDMTIFTLAIRLITKKECECNVWFGLNDDRKTPLKEDFWKPRNMFSDNFPSSEVSSYVNKSDLKRAKKLFHNIRPIYLEKSYSKIKNALTFFEMNYREKAFIYRLMNQSIILESLFADNDKEGISYKIALRTSWFLYPREQSKRLELFNELKNIYSLRSRLIHGDDYESTAAKLHSEKSSYGYMTEILEKLNVNICNVLFKIFMDPKLISIFNASSESHRKKLRLFLDALVIS